MTLYNTIHISLGKVLEHRIHFQYFFKMRKRQERSNFLGTLKIILLPLLWPAIKFFHIWTNSTSEMEQTIPSFGYKDGTSDYLKQFPLEKD